MFIGEIAALLAAAGFSLASVCYTFAGRKVNAVTSLAMSLPASWLLIVVVHLLVLGEPFPAGAPPIKWFYLGASGVLAFVLSSYCMLNAYQHIGPRLTMLIASCTPLLGALLAWLFLGQALPPNAAWGIGLVTFGILWVVVERSPTPQGQPQSDLPKSDLPQFNRLRGTLFAVLGTIAQATAFVFSSLGVSDGFPPLSATLMRITVGVVLLWVFLTGQGKATSTARAVYNDGRLAWQLTGAAVLGPVLAGSLVLLSFQHLAVGVATTLSHTTSIMLIPIGYFVFREAITPRAIAGTLIAVLGIGVLFS